MTETSFPGLTTTQGLTYDDQVRLGLFLHDYPRDAFAERFDPIEGEAPSDLGWIGCDRQGVWTKIHPLVALSGEPRIWSAVAMCDIGPQEIGYEEYAKYPHSHLTARHILLAAKARLQAKLMKERPT